MTKEQYDGFVAALLAAEKVDFKDWETTLPISTAACRSKSWPSAVRKPCVTAR